MHVGLGVALVLALAMCAVPLLGIHGIESALVLGVVLPPFCAYASAALTRQWRVQQPRRGLANLFNSVLGFAGVLWLLPIVVLAFDALRVRSCSPLEGFTFMLLGPGFGIALAAVSGMLVALLLPRRHRSPLLAAAIPVLTMLLALWRFYSGPSIFAYGHFYGFFPGTLYDENIALTTPLLTLRVATSFWLLGLCILVVSCTDTLTLQLRLPPRFPLALGMSVAFVAAGVLSEVYSDQLGHTSSTARVRAALGGERESERCRLFFPREWAQRDRNRLAEDCDFRVHQAESWLGLTQQAKLDVYLFRSPAEKYALMGAEGTNIAKPWRSEVYISEQGWPNPVLGHEIVHVVVGATGRGPFRISGGMWGLSPNPALIEGVATAAAWQAQGGLTPHEWAHAMLELGMIPRLQELFGAGFLGQQKRLAYTLSGSLLRFVQERWGQRAIRATYASGDLATGVGVPLEQIEAAWRASLRAQPLAKSTLELATARFGGGGILSALCPHTLAKLRDELRADFGAGDDASARHTCSRILAVDANDAATRASLAALYARSGDMRAANAELAALEKLKAPAPYIASVQQSLADQALREARSGDALALYEQLLLQPLDDDQKRQLQVKALASRAALTRGDPAAQLAGQRQAQIFFELLVGAPGERADGATAVFLARELRGLRDDGLPQYLESRQLFFQARFGYAASLMAEARARTLPSSELAAEALRVEAISRLALRDLDAASELLQAYAKTGGAAREVEAADYLARIKFMARTAVAVH